MRGGATCLIPCRHITFFVVFFFSILPVIPITHSQAFNSALVLKSVHVFPIIAHTEMALSFALSFAVLLSAVLPVPVQSSYCASTCPVHVTQPILFFVANAPNHIHGLSRKPMVDPHRSKLVYLLYSLPFTFSHLN